MAEDKGWSSTDMAALVAGDLPRRGYVNLGIGLPTKVAAHVESSDGLLFHSENGVLGIGDPAPEGSSEDLIDAGKNPVSLRPGGSFFSHTDAFVMIRGGHLDVAVLGAYQISVAGDLSNWTLGRPGESPAVGGAMDLVYGARRVWVMARHLERDGSKKLLAECRLPLTGKACVDRVYTDLGVLEPAGDHWRLLRVAPGITLAQVQDATEGTVLAVAGAESLEVDAS